MAQKTATVSFSILVRRHLPDVLEIERSGWPPFWDDGDFQRCLKHPQVKGYMAEMGRTYKPVGFILFTSLPKGIQLVNLGVHADFRRQGIGKQLISGVAAHY